MGGKNLESAYLASTMLKKSQKLGSSASRKNDFKNSDAHLYSHFRKNPELTLEICKTIVEDIRGSRVNSGFKNPNKRTGRHGVVELENQALVKKKHKESLAVFNSRKNNRNFYNDSQYESGLYGSGIKTSTSDFRAQQRANNSQLQDQKIEDYFDKLRNWENTGNSRVTGPTNAYSGFDGGNHVQVMEDYKKNSVVCVGSAFIGDMPTNKKR
jgi:hypothetical protein